MIRSDEVTFGADIEHFIAKKPPQSEYEQYGYPYNPRDVVPCVGICEGTKDKPWRNEKWQTGFGLQEDNVMLEYNVPAVKTAKNFGNVIKKAQRYARSFLKEKDLVLVMDKTYHEFHAAHLTSPQAETFGCEPDFDAYEMGRKRINVPNFNNLRTCGGHLHIGGNFKCPDWVAVLMFEFVLFHSFGSTWVLNPKDPRSKWYGRPGIFRSKPYGIEYRTLSNWWTQDAYNSTAIAQRLGTTAKTLIETPAQLIQNQFRTIEWTRLRRALLNSYPQESNGKYTKPGHRERMQDFEALQQQYNNITLEL